MARFLEFFFIVWEEFLGSGENFWDGEVSGGAGTNLLGTGNFFLGGGDKFFGENVFGCLDFLDIFRFFYQDWEKNQDTALSINSAYLRGSHIFG